VTRSALIVGLGAIGMGYDLRNSDRTRVCSHARAMREHPAFGTIAGVDPDAVKRAEFEVAFASPAYGSLEEALSRYSPDVVIVATPTASHEPGLMRSLELASPKAILCEKPLAHETAAAERMVEACKAQGVALYVNYMRRADPGVATVRTMIERGEIQGPLKAIVWYSKGLIHNGSHFVDLMRHWLGPVRAARLIARGQRRDDGDAEPDFVLEHERGDSYFVAADEKCFSHYTVEVLAQNGRLRYERGGESLQWQNVIDDPDFPGYRILSSRPRVLPADMSRYQWHVAEQLSRALRGEDNLLCSGDEGLHTLLDLYRVIDQL
jgi:predicted dehydrogenase